MPMLTPEEIELADDWLTPDARGLACCEYCDAVVCADCVPRKLCMQALEAARKQPGTEATLHRKNVRIAVLEAKLDEVRKFRDTLNGSGCAWEETIKPFQDALTAALNHLDVRITGDDALMQRPPQRRFNGGMPDPDKEG